MALTTNSLLTRYLFNFRQHPPAQARLFLDPVTGQPFSSAVEQSANRRRSLRAPVPVRPGEPAGRAS